MANVTDSQIKWNLIFSSLLNNHAHGEFLRWTTCLNSISIHKNDPHPHKKVIQRVQNGN